MTFPSMLISADVRILADAFLATPVGEMITFSQMSEALGADIDARRYLVQRAIQTASKESGAIFSSIRSVGYKRLPAEEIPAVGAHSRNRIRRITKRAASMLTRAMERANDMSDDDRRKTLSEISTLQMVNFLSSDRAIKNVTPSDKPQPVAVVLRAMASAIGA
jgi:hypothetical protein